MDARITIFSILMGASLTACSFEQAGFDELGHGVGAAEDVGSVSAPLNVTAMDRQPAAAALRGVRSTVNGIPTVRKDLYVFICDNHQLKVRTKGTFGWSLAGWQSVAPDYPCDSAPTVGVIRNTESNRSDILGVYWRSDTSLMEAWYNKNGTLTVTNLLDHDPSHIPAMEGSPVVSDTSDPSKIQVVIKRSAGNQIWTIAWTGSAYSSLPVRRADGTIFTTTANDFYTIYNAGYGREYISIEDSTTFNHVIFSRPPGSWFTSYTEWAKVTDGVNGLLTIGGKSSSLRPDCQGGFAMRLNGISMIEGSCLDTWGDLTFWEQVSPGGQDTNLHGAPESGTNWMYGVDSGVVWLYSVDPLIAQGTLPWDASGAASAFIQPKNGSGYVFWAKNVNGVKRLIVADYSGVSNLNDASIRDLGGNLIY
jgi:hypothetical protein